jgi:hypothetical protein
MAGLTFGQLPEEESDFLTFVQKTGAVWARAVRDDAKLPKFEPLPAPEFLARFAAEIKAYSSVDVYLGFRDDVLHPEICTQEVIEGGTRVPFIQNGCVVPGVHTIVGGTKVKREFIDPRGSKLVRYDRGEFRSVDELASSNLGFSPGTFKGETWVSHPASFMKWGKKILDWMRRRTPESVPVYRCNYEMRATVRVAEACKKGMKLC